MKISELLTVWFKEHARNLPWKSDHDPYTIWVSEILLQQTRVEQAKPYYRRFISRFPTMAALAEAPLDELLRLWQGLGYYSRARNMHTAAKQVMEQFGGLFPRTAREIGLLKGVGPYTAAAIAAFAFEEPVVALDGNVYRIFSRLYANPTPIDTPAGRNLFLSLAQEALDQMPASVFNQALMDFGAIVCTPQPKCGICPLTSLCHAYTLHNMTAFPVKRAKKALRHRYFYYLHVRLGSDTFIQQRTGKDIWQNLYQFPLIETAQPIPPDAVPQLPEWQAVFHAQEPCVAGWSSEYVHRLTHQVLHAYFIRIDIYAHNEWLHQYCAQIHESHIDRFGISRLTERYLLNQPT